MSLRLKLVAAAALAVFASTVARADEIVTYTLTDASFDDGSTLSGSWSVDVTTGSLLSLEFSKTAGSFIGPNEYGATSDATTFDLGNTQYSYLNVNIDNNNQGIDEINIESPDSSQFLNFDFYVETGVVYTGDASLGSNDDVATGYTALSGAGTTTPGGGGGSPVPEPASLALFCAGLLGLGVGRRCFG